MAADEVGVTDRELAVTEAVEVGRHLDVAVAVALLVLEQVPPVRHRVFHRAMAGEEPLAHRADDVGAVAHVLEMRLADEAGHISGTLRADGSRSTNSSSTRCR